MDSRSNLMKSISVIGVLLVFLAPYLSFIRDNIGVVEETDELYAFKNSIYDSLYVGGTVICFIGSLFVLGGIKAEKIWSVLVGLGCYVVTISMIVSSISKIREAGFTCTFAAGSVVLCVGALWIIVSEVTQRVVIWRSSTRCLTPKVNTFGSI